MASYSIGLRGEVCIVATAQWAILSPGNCEAAIHEIILQGIQTFSGSAVVGIGRPSNTPVLMDGGIALLSDDESRPTYSMARVHTKFTTPPTVPSQFFRRGTAVVASGTLFSFPRGLVIPANGAGICVWTIAINNTPAFEISCVINE